eukprot:scaffold123105_cov30-Tisochrysis_lutea.AAC.1
MPLRIGSHPPTALSPPAPPPPLRSRRCVSRTATANRRPSPPPPLPPPPLLPTLATAATCSACGRALAAALPPPSPPLFLSHRSTLGATNRQYKATVVCRRRSQRARFIHVATATDFVAATAPPMFGVLPRLGSYPPTTIFPSPP